jgi:hypothetical protein
MELDIDVKGLHDALQARFAEEGVTVDVSGTAALASVLANVIGSVTTSAAERALARGSTIIKARDVRGPSATARPLLAYEIPVAPNNSCLFISMRLALELRTALRVGEAWLAASHGALNPHPPALNGMSGVMVREAHEVRARVVDWYRSGLWQPLPGHGLFVDERRSTRVFQRGDLIALEARDAGGTRDVPNAECPARRAAITEYLGEIAKPDRWGGSAEIIAFSYSAWMPVAVYQRVRDNPLFRIQVAVPKEQSEECVTVTADPLIDRTDCLSVSAIVDHGAESTGTDTSTDTSRGCGSTSSSSGSPCTCTSSESSGSTSPSFTTGRSASSSASSSSSYTTDSSGSSGSSGSGSSGSSSTTGSSAGSGSTGSSEGSSGSGSSGSGSSYTTGSSGSGSSESDTTSSGSGSSGSMETEDSDDDSDDSDDGDDFDFLVRLHYKGGNHYTLLVTVLQHQLLRLAFGDAVVAHMVPVYGEAKP